MRNGQVNISRTSADRRLAKGNLANLYAGNTELGWRIIKQVPIAQGLRRVAQRKWQRLYFEDGSFAGFLMAKPLELPSGGLFPGWSPSTITAKESQLNAGLYGPSRTMGLTTRLNRQRDPKKKLI